MNVIGISVDGEMSDLLLNTDDIWSVKTEILRDAFPPKQELETVTKDGEVKLTIKKQGDEVLAVSVV